MSQDLPQMEFKGKLYDLVPAKKPRKKAEYTQEGLAARERNADILRQIVARAKALFYDQGLKENYGWKYCVTLASYQLKNEGAI